MFWCFIKSRDRSENHGIFWAGIHKDWVQWSLQGSKHSLAVISTLLWPAELVPGVSLHPKRWLCHLQSTVRCLWAVQRTLAMHSPLQAALAAHHTHLDPGTAFPWMFLRWEFTFSLKSVAAKARWLSLLSWWPCCAALGVTALGVTALGDSQLFFFSQCLTPLVTASITLLHLCQTHFASPVVRAR